jgi:hypothetical protein
MSYFKQRVRRLEQRRRSRGPVAHVGWATLPWDLPEEAMWDWVDEHVVCECGDPACARMRLVVVPEKAPSIEAWQTRFGDMLRCPPETRKAAEDEWYKRYRGEAEDDALLRETPDS